MKIVNKDSNQDVSGSLTMLIMKQGKGVGTGPPLSPLPPIFCPCLPSIASLIVVILIIIQSHFSNKYKLDNKTQFAIRMRNHWRDSTCGISHFWLLSIAAVFVAKLQGPVWNLTFYAIRSEIGAKGDYPFAHMFKEVASLSRTNIINSSIGRYSRFGRVIWFKLQMHQAI